jgi:hypothetical protein
VLEYLTITRREMTIRKRFVTVIDYAAFIIAFMFLAVLVGTVLAHAVRDALHDIASVFARMWAHHRIILAVVAFAVLWCCTRWKVFRRFSRRQGRLERTRL